MPTGQEHVSNTLAICADLQQHLGALTTASEAWRAEKVQRIETIRSTLLGLQERFFLKSKLCLPFAARCYQEASRLQELVLSLQGEASLEVEPRVDSAMDLLDRAVKALDERSAMQGMTIT